MRFGPLKTIRRPLSRTLVSPTSTYSTTTVLSSPNLCYRFALSSSIQIESPWSRQMSRQLCIFSESNHFDSLTDICGKGSSLKPPGPYAWVKHVPGEPIQISNPNKGSVKRLTCSIPIGFCNNGRFFATSSQAKTKKEVVSGPRLNDQITAQFIRLVTDEGHGVVPMCEALKQAMKLKLDLVEVDRTVDPPVCKIMDFHKEKYMRQVKEKDRAKSKSEVTLKKGGGFKEVRFSAKTEQMDLKIKADSAIRLMERGYRVKCMALLLSTKKGSKALTKGSGDEVLTEEEIAERRRLEEEEREELRALLSRLVALMGDEFIIESGPFVEKRQAYVLVRHAKFGPSKKGSAKKWKDVENFAEAQPAANHSGPIASSSKVEKDSAESGTENDEYILSDQDDLAQSSPENENRYKSQPSPGNENRYKPQPSPGTENRYKSQPSPRTENRYKRSEVRQQFPRDSWGPDKTDSFRFESRFSPRNGHPQPERTITSSIRESKPVRTDSSGFRDVKRNVPSSPPASSFGMFSSSKAGEQGVSSEVNNNREGNRYSSGRDSNGEGNRYSSARNSNR